MRLALCVIIFFVSLSPLWGDNWKYQGEANLKKDEIYHLAFQEGSTIKDLYFRWTLHKNEGLVVHLRYDGFVHQFVLYERYHRRGFKLQLFKQASRAYASAPYIWILFKDYQYDTKTATLRFLVFDGNKSVSLISEQKVKNVGFRGY